MVALRKTKRNNCLMPAKNKQAGKVVAQWIKYTVFATNVIAILLLFLSVSAWYIVPSKLTFVAYLGLGFPFILAVNVIYLVLWIIFWRWRYALVQFVVLILCWIPISTYFPINFKTKDVPEESFKILTYNVRGFNWLTGKEARKNPMLDYIAESDADIICLQEFAVSTRKDRGGIITESELNKILKKYPYRSIERLGNRKGHTAYGIACYSKFPIHKSALLPLNSTFNGAAIYEMEIKGKLVTFVNVHLESNRINAEDKKLYSNFLKNSADRETFDAVANNIQERLGVAYKSREEQANIIAKYIAEQNTMATIVCGDFNDTPISYAYHHIRGNMIDAYANSGLGQGMTYHENHFWFRIDFMMHSLAFQSYNSTVGKVKYSDHYPVWTYLHFR